MYEELKPFMEELHATGAKMFVQLTAALRSFTVSDLWRSFYTNPPLRALSKPFLTWTKICATKRPLAQPLVGQGSLTRDDHR